MGAAVLRDNTMVAHPDTGAPVSLLAGTEVPEWAEGLIGDHLLVSGPPPLSGKGSGKDAWAAYAAANDVEVDEDATRDAIVDALEAAGVATESDSDA